MRVVIDHAMRKLHLSRNANSQVERPSAEQASAGYPLALTERAKVALSSRGMMRGLPRIMKRRTG